MLRDIIEKENEDALRSGAISYLDRGLTLCSFPYKELKGETEYVRENGIWALRMIGSKELGLPYGSIPRLLHIYLANEAIRTQCRKISLGRSLIDLIQCADEKDDITGLINQIQRFFRSKIILTFTDEEGEHLKCLNIADELSFWWANQRQDTFWDSCVSLNKSYFEELIQSPVSIHLKIVEALKSSPLELDIYFWLSHRVFYLHRPTTIPYDLFHFQFGSEYKRLIDFKNNFLTAFKNIHKFFPELKFSEEKHSLKLFPSKSLIKPHPSQDIIFK